MKKLILLLLCIISINITTNVAFAKEEQPTQPSITDAIKQKMYDEQVFRDDSGHRALLYQQYRVDKNYREHVRIAKRKGESPSPDYMVVPLYDTLARNMFIGYTLIYKNDMSIAYTYNIAGDLAYVSETRGDRRSRPYYIVTYSAIGKLIGINYFAEDGNRYSYRNDGSFQLEPNLDKIK